MKSIRLSAFDVAGLCYVVYVALLRAFSYNFLLSYRGPGMAGARKTHDLPRALRAPCTRALTRSAFLSRHNCNSNPGRAGQIPAFDFELLELLRPWLDRLQVDPDGFWSRAVYKCIR